MNRCAICGWEGSPDCPLNCLVDTDSGPVAVCFSGRECSDREAERLAVEPLPFVKASDMDDGAEETCDLGALNDRDDWVAP